MFTPCKTLRESESTLANAGVSKSALKRTTRVMLSPLDQIARGRWSRFKSWKSARRLDGSSMNSKSHAVREADGSKIMLLPLGSISRATRRREGSSRESKRDYLHFLYIARGSLSETKYFIHLAQRLGYLSLEEAEALREQTKMTFGCLHGLIKAVEREAGKISKVVATITSLVVIGLIRWSSSQLSVVS